MSLSSLDWYARPEQNARRRPQFGDEAGAGDLGGFIGSFDVPEGPVDLEVIHQGGDKRYAIHD
jgi:hypothetical protein